MKTVLAFLFFISTLFSTIVPPETFARSNALTPEQQEHLRTTQHIRIQVLALTEKGLTESDGIQHVISERLRTLGLSIAEAPTKPHDVVLKVKCEERRSTVAMTTLGGDADRLGSSSRHWKGPACQLTFRIDGQAGLWRQEVRTPFKDAREAAKIKGRKDSGQYALDQLQAILQQHDFPFELLAEWKQEKRLATVLTSLETPLETQHTILRLANKVPGPAMLQALRTLLENKDLASHATQAMGFMGTAASPFLLDLLEKSDSVEIRAMAAQALGEIGAHSGDTSILPPLLAMMDLPDIDLQLQTEIVLAVGKVPDHQSQEPLQELGLKAWTSPSRAPDMQRLREAIEWSLWQINPSAHTEE